MKTHEDRVRDFLLSKIRSREGHSELTAMPPGTVDWQSRCEATLDLLLPRLIDLASEIKVEVPNRLNAANQLLNQIEEAIVSRRSDPSTLVMLESFKERAQIARDLIGDLESQQISAAIQNFVASESGIGDLVYSNGNSIYPDFVCKSYDYSDLTLQSRQNPIDGPCLRGSKSPKPSNVPDGLELKTNKGSRIRVDAHGAHAGLHLGVTWNFGEVGVDINGVWIGFIREFDHKESGRNVQSTTVKYSFGHDHFISLLP